MKKIIISALTLLALVSCAKEQTPSPVNPGATPIVFGSPAVLATKSVTESTVSTIQTDGFNVACVKSDNSVYFNSKAVWESANSYYNPAATGNVYYYPNSGTVSFYACHPVSESISVTSGAATIAYTQSGSKDLVVAKKTGVSAQSSSVALTFDHALAKCIVTAKGDDPKVTYKLKSVSLNAPATGTYAFATSTWTPGTASAVSFYSDASGMDISTSAATAVATPLTFVPGKLVLTASWECYIGTELVGSYTASTAAVTEANAVNLQQGKENTINLTLKNADAKTITFTVSLNAWGTSSQDITLQ